MPPGPRVLCSAAWRNAGASPRVSKPTYDTMMVSTTPAAIIMSTAIPASIAGMAQLHETTTSGESMDSMDEMDDDSMTAMKGMKEVAKIDIPAGGSVQLKPGGYHIMLMELAKPIAAGDTVPVTLTFEKAGEVTVDAVARES